MKKITLALLSLIFISSAPVSWSNSPSTKHFLNTLFRLNSELKSSGCKNPNACTEHASRVCVALGECYVMTPKVLWEHLKSEARAHPSLVSSKSLAAERCAYFGSCSGDTTPQKLEKALPNISKEMLEELGMTFKKKGLLHKFFGK